MENSKIRELLDMEAATRLLMDYYKAETNGIMVASDGSVRFQNSQYREMYERAEKKYMKVSGIRERVIKEIEDYIFDNGSKTNSEE